MYAMSRRRRLLVLVFAASVMMIVTLIARSTRADTAEPATVDQGSPVRDAWVEGRLETAYALNPSLNAFAIDTTVAAGIVRLSGTVPTEIERDLALAIAHEVEGVAQVHSELKVDPSARSADNGSAGNGERSFYQSIQDVTTTARVRGNLVSHGKTQGLGIDVETHDSVVTLRGSVPSRTEMMLAEMIVRNTENISSVQNKLKIEKKS